MTGKRAATLPEPPRGGVGVLGPPGPAYPGTHFIAGAPNEISHHATQIGTLRDPT
jgi:hypothetical protein